MAQHQSENVLRRYFEIFLSVFAAFYILTGLLPLLMFFFKALEHCLGLSSCHSYRVTDNWAYNRKLVIIGDGACGKTSLLSVFTLGYFPTVSHPSLFMFILAAQ